MASRKPRASGLPPCERAWLQRHTFTRPDEWGGNPGALGMPAFGLALLTLAQDFACGATEEVKRDCILIRRDGKIEILPLVADWNEFEHVLKREAAALPPASLLGYAPQLRAGAAMDEPDIVESHREFVYHRASAAEMIGPSLSK